MSLRTLIEEALVAVATDIVDLETATESLRADLTAAAQSGGAAINDAGASASTVYSSAKVSQLVTDAVQTAVAGILNGAPDALNDLNELAAALGDNKDFAASVTAALGNRVRFDSAQVLTTAQQAQARANMGAVAASDIGDTTTSLSGVYAAAKS